MKPSVQLMTDPIEQSAVQGQCWGSPPDSFGPPAISGKLAEIPCLSIIKHQHAANIHKHQNPTISIHQTKSINQVQALPSRSNRPPKMAHQWSLRGSKINPSLGKSVFMPYLHEVGWKAEMNVWIYVMFVRNIASESSSDTWSKPSRLFWVGIRVF